MLLEVQRFLSNHTVYNLRLAFLPDPIGSYYRFETTFRARTRDNSKNYSESGLRCPAAPAPLLLSSGYRRPLVQKASVRSKDAKAQGSGALAWRGVQPQSVRGF
jgi:hypothetical protein